MSVIARRPFVRWAVPAAALAVALGGGVAVNSLRASADTTLPARTPAQLLADIQSARLDAGSGTVVESADLGLPSLPGLPGGAGGTGSSDLTSLVTGSHTLRVWYAGSDKVRVALLGATAESDVIRNGTDLWVWSSTKNEATHTTLPNESGKAAPTTPSQLPSTPQQAADDVLKALDPTTSVSTADTLTVAGRAAYDLVLRPKDSSSLIGSVHIAIDGQKHVPLQVQVFPQGSDSAAFSIGFRSVSFGTPDDALFTFTPPKGVKVTENQDTGKPDTSSGAKPQTAVVGTGWTSVLVAKSSEIPGVGAQANAQASPQLQALLGTLPTVSGSWGSGRVLSGKLFSALLTDDGRVLVGAVSAQRLTEAAADPAAALK